MLDKSMSALTLMAAGPSEESRRREQESAARVDLARSTLERSKETLDRTVRKWRKQLSVEAGQRQLERSIREARPRGPGACRSLYGEVHQHWARKKAEMLEELTGVRSSLRKELDGLELQAARAAFKTHEMRRVECPDAEAHISRTQVEVKVRGWFESLKFWPEYDLQWQVDVDWDSVRSSLVQFLQNTITALGEHLGWWCEYMDAVFLDPLRTKVGEERTVLEECAVRVRESEEVLAKVEAARSELGSIAEISRAQADRHRSCVRLKDGGTPTPAVSPPAKTDRRTPSSVMALSPVIESFRELELQREFGRIIESLTESPRRILLLGAERARNLRLLSLLLHDLGSLESLSRVPAKTWIVASEVPFERVPGRTARIYAGETILRDLTLVLAPSDGDLEPVDWKAFIDDFDVVGLDIDYRVASGRSDLEQRAPYRDALFAAHQRVFLVCGDAALFGGAAGLAHLLTDLRPEFQSTPLANQPWLVFEDFDVRYSHFMELAGTVDRDRGTPAQLEREWRNAGHSVTPPFEPAVLRQAMVHLLQREEEVAR